MKFNSFELHHILQHDNAAADALTQLGSSHEQPPPGVFVQDLIKSSIRLDEDNSTPVLGTPPGLEIEAIMESSLSTFGSDQYRSMKSRPGTWDTGPRGTSFTTVSCIIVVL
jgi:hypothetical protein